MSRPDRCQADRRTPGIACGDAVPTLTRKVSALLLLASTMHNHPHRAGEGTRRQPGRLHLGELGRTDEREALEHPYLASRADMNARPGHLPTLQEVEFGWEVIGEPRMDIQQGIRAPHKSLGP